MNRRHTLLLTLAFAAYLAALVASAVVAVRVDLFSWDLDITQWVQDVGRDYPQGIRDALFWMGLRGVAGATFLGLVAFLWWRRHRIAALHAVAFIGLPDLFNITLREIIGRPRPTPELGVNVEVGYGGAQGATFPSGTALHVLLFYGFVMYLLPRYLPSRRWGLTLYILLVAYMLATGLWLIYDGRHWFTDVMGGYLYGGFYLLVLIVSTRHMEGVTRRHGGLPLPAWTPGVLRRPLLYLFSG